MMRKIAKIPFHKNLSIPSRNQSTDPKGILIRKISTHNCFFLKQKENSRFPFISPKPFSLINSSFFCTQKEKKYDNEPLKEGSDRTDWKILRDIKQLEKNIGQFIQLPRLPFPKGFTQDSIKNFLLTKQRFQLLSEVIQFIERSRGEEFSATEGMCLSGPQGVGKTAINYLFACFGWANEYPVLYIPLVSEWISQGIDDQKNEYLIQQFWELNQDICKKNQYLSEDLIKDIEDKNHNPSTVRNNLFLELKKLKTAPVFYLFDEHNEIFRENVHSGYWRPFTIWTSVTSGIRTFTVYSGSAHSAFETKIPSGEERKMRYIRPFEKDEFETMIKYYKLNERFHASSEEIEEAIGRIPRLIIELTESSSESLKWFAETKQEKYFQEIQNTWRKIEPDEKKRYLDMLDNFFLKQESSVIRPTYFYDRGLFEVKDSKFLPINGPARRALFDFWRTNLSKEPVDLAILSPTTGWAFEAAVLKTLISPSNSTLTGFFASEKKQPTPRLIRTQQLQYFKDISSISSHHSESTLYIPDKFNFKSWDCFIHHPNDNHIIFIQISVMNPFEKSKIERIANSFKRKENEKSLTERIVSQLLKIDTISIDFTEGNLKSSTQSPISFIYIWSGKREELMAKSEDISKKNNYLKDLIIADRDDCEKIGVLFKL